MRAVGRRGALAMLAAPVLMGQAPGPAPVFPPGSAIGLVPPPGMTLAEGFAGFADTVMGASVLLTELPAGAYKGTELPDNDASQQPSNFNIVERRRIQVGSISAVLLRGTQRVSITDYEKWVLIAHLPDFTAMVTIHVPPWSTKRYPSPAVEAALATVSFRFLGGAANDLSALPFTMDNLAGFRLVGARAHTVLGSIARFTEGPLDLDPEKQQPMLIALWSRLQMAVPQAEWESYALRALADVHLTDPTVNDAEAIMSSSNHWLMIEATGNDLVSTRPTFVFQAILFADAGVLWIQGRCAAGLQPVMAPRFRQAALSATLR